ncbi:MAG: CHC2 zinc finger domain-containing protein [Dehalococcoidia bacterium]|nr:CHC2 zinc finger domain-containing protein [Dehalococcoidia bacterium]
MVYDIDGIKHRNPIEEVVAGHGVALRRSGTHLMGLCPFHQDEHPSLVVYPETRSFYCFGCGASGDVIDFVRRAEGLSFVEALERLGGHRDGRTSLAGQAAHTSNPLNRDPDRGAAFSERLSLDDRMILTAACGVYHEALLRTPKALQYLEERGVGLPVARRCRVGYSDGRSLRRYLQRRRLGLRRATEMGLFWPRHGRGETMAGRIVVPELRGGQCIWMLGRALDDDRQPKYWGLSLPKPILGYERVRGRHRVFVTEGAFDYLTGVSWGLPICALLGTQVRAGRLAFLERARRVLIVFDNDGPGCEAAAELAGRLGSRARVVRLAEGAKDLNDLARRPDGRATFFRVLKEADRGAGEATHEDEDDVETSS